MVSHTMRLGFGREGKVETKYWLVSSSQLGHCVQRVPNRQDHETPLGHALSGLSPGGSDWGILWQGWESGFLTRVAGDPCKGVSVRNAAGCLCLGLDKVCRAHAREPAAGMESGTATVQPFYESPCVSHFLGIGACYFFPFDICGYAPCYLQIGKWILHILFDDYTRNFWQQWNKFFHDFFLVVSFRFRFDSGGP